MNESYLRLPNPNEYISLIENYKGAILRWTTAPELPGALEMGDYLTSHGICASIGHSAADYQTVQEAFRHGYTHVTHLYSARTHLSGIRNTKTSMDVPLYAIFSFQSPWESWRVSD